MIKVIRKQETFRPALVTLMGTAALERDTILDMIAGTQVRVTGGTYTWVDRRDASGLCYCDLTVWLWIES